MRTGCMTLDMMLVLPPFMGYTQVTPSTIWYVGHCMLSPLMLCGLCWNTWGDDWALKLGCNLVLDAVRSQQLLVLDMFNNSLEQL